MDYMMVSQSPAALTTPTVHEATLVSSFPHLSIAMLARDDVDLLYDFTLLAAVIPANSTLKFEVSVGSISTVICSLDCHSLFTHLTFGFGSLQVELIKIN